MTFDNSFYENLLKYLELHFHDFSYYEELDPDTGEPVGTYMYELSDFHTTKKGFKNLKDLIDDIFNHLVPNNNY